MSWFLPMTGDAGKAIKGSSPDIRRISVWVKPRPLQDQQIIRFRDTLGLFIFDYWILAIFSSTFAIINWMKYDLRGHQRSDKGTFMLCNGSMFVSDQITNFNYVFQCWGAGTFFHRLLIFFYRFYIFLPAQAPNPSR